MKIIRAIFFGVATMLAVIMLAGILSMNVTATEAGEVANTTEVAQTESDIREKLFEQFDFGELDTLLADIFPKDKITFKETIMGLITGDVTFSLDLVKQLVIDQFTYELRVSKTGMIHILLLVIIAAIFSNFSEVFHSTQVSEISFSMLYMLLITICLNNFRILVESASDNVTRLMEFMELLGPVYFMAVAISTGSSTSITFYQLVLLLIFVIEILILDFLIPLTQVYLMIKILGEISTEIHLTKFAELIETIVSWLLKSLLAGVIGLNVIQGLISPAIDSIKRSIMTKGGEALPIIGDAIGGTTEVVLGTAVLIKNGIGVAGMIVCLIICLSPMIQMGVTALVYQLVCALVQPISDKRMVDCISSMANGTKLLLRIVFTTGVLFLLTVAVVAATTGG